MKSAKKTVSKVAGRGAALESAEKRPGRKRHKSDEIMASKHDDPKLNATPVLLIKNVFNAQSEPPILGQVVATPPEKRGRGRPRSVGVKTPVGVNLMVQPATVASLSSDSAIKKGQPRKSKAAAANVWLPMAGKSRVGVRPENGVDRSASSDTSGKIIEAEKTSDDTPGGTPVKRKRGRPPLKPDQTRSKSVGATPKTPPKPKVRAPKAKPQEVSEDEVEEEVKKPEEVVETGAVGRRARQLKSRKSLGDDFIELKLKHIRRVYGGSDSDSEDERQAKKNKKRRLSEEEEVDDDDDSDADEMANGEEMSDEEMLEKDEKENDEIEERLMDDQKENDKVKAVMTDEEEMKQGTGVTSQAEKLGSQKVDSGSQADDSKDEVSEIQADMTEVPPKKDQVSTVITLTKQGSTPTKTDVPKVSTPQKVVTLPQLDSPKNVVTKKAQLQEDDIAKPAKKAPKNTGNIASDFPAIQKVPGRRGRPRKLASTPATSHTTTVRRQSARERAEFPQQQAPKLNVPLPLHELLASVNRSDAPELRTLYMFQSAERNGWLKIVYKRLRHLAAVPVGSMAACQYQCPFCPHRAVVPRDVADHLHSRHPSLAAIAEGKCTRVFTTFLFMFCRHCDYVAYEKLALWYHYDHFHGVRNMLASRYRGANYADVTLPELSPAVLSSARTLLCCQQCQFYSVNKQFAVLHTLRTHPEKEGTSGFVTLKQLDAVVDVDDDTGKVPRETVGGRTMLTRECFVCNECLFIAYKRALVELHCINTHARRVLLFVCSLCSSFQCTAAYQMSEHVAAMHPDARRQVCSVTLVDNDGVEDPCLCSAETRDGDKRMESWPAITAQAPTMHQQHKAEDEDDKEDQDNDDDEFAKAIATAIPDDDDPQENVLSEAEAQEELLALAAQAAAAHPEHAVPHKQQIEPVLVLPNTLVKSDGMNPSPGLVQTPMVGIQTPMANIQTSVTTSHINSPMPVIQTPIAAMQTPVTAIHTPIQTPVAAVQAAAMHTPSAVAQHTQGVIQIPGAAQTLQPTSVLRPTMASEAAHTSLLQPTNADVPMTAMSAGSVVHADELAERLAQREPDTVATGGASAEQLEILAEAARTGQLSGAGLHAIQGPDGSVTYVQLVFEDEGGAGDATNTGDECQLQLAVDAEGNYQLVQMVDEAENPPEGAMEHPQPVVQTFAEPVAEPVVEASEAPAAPVIEPAIEPTVQPSVEPAIEPTAQPSAEPAIESAAEPAAELAIEPAIDPAVEPTIEPVIQVQPIAETIPEPVVQPIAEVVPEPVAESMPMALAQPVPETEPVMETAVAAPAEEQSKQVILQYTVGDETVYLCCDQDMLFSADGTMQLDAASLLPAAEAAVAAAGAAPPGQDRIFYLQNEATAAPPTPAPQPPPPPQPQAPAVRQPRQRAVTPRARQPGPRASAGRSIVRPQRQQTYVIQHPTGVGRGQRIIAPQQSLLVPSAVSSKANVEPGSYESVFQSFCNTGNT